MSKELFRVAAFAALAMVCSTFIVDVTTSDRLAATQTVAAFA